MLKNRVMKINRFFATAAIVAMAVALSSCGTEWLATVGQSMVGASQAILNAGRGNTNESSASTFMSGNASTMMVDGGVPYGVTYTPGQPTYGLPQNTNSNNSSNSFKLWTEPKIVEGSSNINSGVGTGGNTYEQPKRVKCGVCSGTGHCSTCSGKGVSYHGNQYHKCGGCNGTGNCRTCNGAGWHDY